MGRKRTKMGVTERDVNIRGVPTATLDAFDALAKEEGRSRNGMVIVLMKRFVAGAPRGTRRAVERLKS